MIGPTAGGSWIFIDEYSGSLTIGNGSVGFTGASIITPADDAGFQLGSINDDALTSRSLDADTGASGDESLIGLTGNDEYLFFDDFGTDTVVENANGGLDTLDFSAVSANLTFTILSDDNVVVADFDNPLNIVHASNIENLVGGQGINRYVFLGSTILSGKITGRGDGDDILDFSNYQSQAATGTDGVSGISSVVGSNFDDTIIGTVTGATWDISDAATGRAQFVDFGSVENIVSLSVDDILDFSTFTDPGGVTVDLANGTATGFSSITGFVNVVGSPFDDFLTGDSSDNELTGGEGTNTLTGGGGVDTVVEIGDVDFTLLDDALQIGAVGSDMLVGITQARLAGGDSANIIDASNFTLGPVTLLGGDGDDVLKGGDGDDVLSGNGGIDDLDGGGGFNVIMEEADSRFILTDLTLDMGEGTNAIQNISLDPGVTGGSFTLSYDGETTTDIAFNATASALKLSLTGLSAIGTEDVLVTGDAGDWTIEFVNNLAGLPIALLMTNSGLTGGGATPIVVTTTITGVKQVNTLANIQSAFLVAGGSDNLMDASGFNSGAVVMVGGAGDDIIIGGPSDDSLAGNAGNDRLTGGTGNDQLLGGSGVDTIVENRDADFVLSNVQLMIGTEVDTFTTVATTFTPAYSDTPEFAELTGGALGNQIDASGFSGISIATDVTFLNQGEGIQALADKADFVITLSDGTTAVDIYLSTAVTLQDVFDAISSAHDSLAAILDATGTAIVITDSTVGGAGSLTITAANGSDAAARLGILGTGSASSSAIVLVGTPLAGGSVILDGAGGEDILTGTSGDDTFTGGTGIDTINGGGGSDTLVESRSSELVATDFTLISSDATNSTLEIGSEGIDVLSDIEHATLTGTQAIDTLDASAFIGGSVILGTGGGTDTLKGTGFDDRFEVDVSGLVSGQHVTVDTGGGSGDRVVILGTTGITQADLGWITWQGLPAIQEILDGNIASDLYTNGGSIEVVATTINLNGHTIDSGRANATSPTVSVAGNITLKGRYITIDSGARILAKATAGGVDGAIDILGVDETKLEFGLGFYNSHFSETTITIDNAEISGGNVTIGATAITQRFTSPPTVGDARLSGLDFGSKFDSATQLIIESVKGLSVIVAVSDSTSIATISIGQTAVIEAANFVATTNADARVTPSPFAVLGLAVSVGMVNTTSTVTIEGTIITTGDLTVSANAFNKADVVAQVLPSSAKSGNAIAAAVSVINSNATAHVTDAAILTVGNNLSVISETLDRERVLARAVSGLDGKRALTLALSLGHGYTYAFLDGTADVGGDIEVYALQHKEKINTEVKIAGYIGYIPGVPKAPQVVSGVKAYSAVGQSSTGNLLTDLSATTKNAEKAGAVGGAKFAYAKYSAWKGDSPPGWLSQKFTAIKTKVQSVSKSASDWFSSTRLGKYLAKPGPVKDQTLAVAVAVDGKDVAARIGDGVTTDGSSGANVQANGSIIILAKLESRPDLSAVAKSTNSSLPTEKIKVADSGQGGGIVVGIYNNTANATISGDAEVDAGETLTVQADVLNQIDPSSLWGANLITPFTENSNATYTNTKTGLTLVNPGETVDIDSTPGGGKGDLGSRYKFKGDLPTSIDLTAEDYTNTTLWENLGTHDNQIKQTFLANLTGYLNENLGLDDNLVDSWSQSSATGQKATKVLSATVLLLNHTADATIKNGAQINQDLALRSANQDIVVLANSVNQAVNLVGNFKTPVVGGGSTKSWNISDPVQKQNFQAPGIGASAADDGSAAGASLGVYYFENVVRAVIEDGVMAYADSLKVHADNLVLAIVLGASGSKGDASSRVGVGTVNVINNTTLAQIENGATITVGNKVLSDADAAGGSVWVGAEDTAYVVTVAGTVATSDQSGIGVSIALNTILRNTEAVIGNRLGDDTIDVRGALTSSGAVTLTAANHGFVGSFAIAGAVSTNKPGDQQSVETERPSGTGGTQGSDGSAESDAL